VYTYEEETKGEGEVKTGNAFDKIIEQLNKSLNQNGKIFEIINKRILLLGFKNSLNYDVNDIFSKSNYTWIYFKKLWKSLSYGGYTTDVKKSKSGSHVKLIVNDKKTDTSHVAGVLSVHGNDKDDFLPYELYEFTQSYTCRIVF